MVSKTIKAIKTVLLFNEVNVSKRYLFFISHLKTRTLQFRLKQSVEILNSGTRKILNFDWSKFHIRECTFQNCIAGHISNLFITKIIRLFYILLK